MIYAVLSKLERLPKIICIFHRSFCITKTNNNMELRKKVEIFVDKMLKSDTPEGKREADSYLQN